MNLLYSSTCHNVTEMRNATVFDEFHPETEEFHPAATTTIKADETENLLPVNVIKYDLDEYPSDKTTGSFRNIGHLTANTIILEKIPKIETDEQNLWSDSESNDDPDQDPFADIKCDPNFVLRDNPPSDLTVHTEEQKKSTQTNVTIIHRPNTSEHFLQTPTTTNVQNNSQCQFVCKLCLTKLSSQNNLNSHVRLCSTTHKNGRLFCVDCNIIYASSHGFKRHNLKVHRIGIEAVGPEQYRVQFKSQFCPLKYVLQEKFKIHTESHVKNLDLDTATTAQNDANLQLKLNPYKCQECGSTFSTVGSLSNHVLSKCVDNIFKCPDVKCGKIFNTKDHLNRHFLSHSDDRPFKCPELTCGKSFKLKQRMRGHMTCHYDTKLFICLQRNCSKAFRTEADLAEHDQLHKRNDSDRPARDKPLLCPECHLTFSENGRRTAHVNLAHRKGEPLKCPQADCKKTFKHEYSLSVHVKELHGRNGVTNSFKCPHPGCKFTCKRKTYIKFHMRTHTGERPFKCTVAEGCVKTFIKSSDLKGHIRETHMKNVK